MKTIRNGCLAGGVAVLFLSLSGCGGGSDQPELGQVKGTVTYKGLPLSNVEVVFHPVDGRPARGRTDAEGRYELRYIRDTMGTKVGPNRVEIAPSEEDAEDTLDVTGEDGEPVSLPPDLSAKPVIPAKYNTESELEVNVQPGANTFNFDLDS